MKRILIRGVIVAGIASLVFGCERSAKKESSKQPSTAETDPFAQPKSLQQAGVPVDLTREAIPPDNPQTPEKISLGQKLFCERRLSVDGTVSCSTCHDPHSFFATTPARTPLARETRHILEEALIFRHRSEVKRVVFISTPHRGSELASGWIGRLGASLIHKSQSLSSLYASTKPLLIADPAARPLNRMPNSVDTLEPNDRFVQAVNRLPKTPGIPYDSIIGDRGRGDTPHSSDGVVPYWSSHLDGAQSELIVPSDHMALRNPQAIREVERILKTYP